MALAAPLLIHVGRRSALSYGKSLCLGGMKNILIFVAGGASLIAAVLGWDYYAKNVRDVEVYQALGEALSKSMLRDAVISAESYKLVFGFYPESVEALRGGAFHSDPASGYCKCPTDYYYQRNEDGETYYLFSKGRDCLAFTADDIHPELTDDEKQNIGLRMPTTNMASESKESC